MRPRVRALPPSGPKRGPGFSLDCPAAKRVRVGDPLRVALPGISSGAGSATQPPLPRSCQAVPAKPLLAPPLNPPHLRGSRRTQQDRRGVNVLEAVQRSRDARNNAL